MAEPLLSIAGATKAYRGKVVLRIREFSLYEGERVDVVGANGSGKSTLLRVVAGVTKLSTGRVRAGTPMKTMSVGFVPQQGGIYDELTVRENADLIASIIAGAAAGLASRMDLLKDFGLAPYLDRPAGLLSDGMRRLTTFLSVWAAEPDILLADEPLAGMDVENSLLVERLIQEGTAGHRTFMQSTHSPSTTARLITVQAGVVV